MGYRVYICHSSPKEWKSIVLLGRGIETAPVLCRGHTTNTPLSFYSGPVAIAGLDKPMSCFNFCPQAAGTHF